MLLTPPDEDVSTRTILPYRAFRKQRHLPWALPNSLMDPTFFDRIDKTMATGEDLYNSVYADKDTKCIEPHTDPILALLEIVGQDIQDTFKLIGITLEGINT